MVSHSFLAGFVEVDKAQFDRFISRLAEIYERHTECNFERILHNYYQPTDCISPPRHVAVELVTKGGSSYFLNADDCPPTENKKRAVGRPAVVSARAVNVTLDEASIEVAKQLGNGNISAGIRLALAAASKGR